MKLVLKYFISHSKSIDPIKFVSFWKLTWTNGPTHVVIRAVGWEVASNVNKFCVYVLPSPLCMLSNIADTVNKHKTTWADFFQIWFPKYNFNNLKENKNVEVHSLRTPGLLCQQYYWAYKEGLEVHKRKIYLHFTQLLSPHLW